LGLLVRASIFPLPNLDWWFRWPADIPKPDGWQSWKRYMSETVFKRYWKYACIPGIFGGVEDAELDTNGRTQTY
jgi:hypothetical protein